MTIAPASTTAAHPSLTGRKCLVTGGASFIGSHLVETVLQMGAAIRVADDLSSGSLANLDSVKSEIDFLEGDLRHADFAISAVAGCEIVFHLAADHGGRGYIDSHPANCIGNMALDHVVLDAAARSGVERFVYASSACVYPVDLQRAKTLLREEMAGFDRQGGAFPDGEYGWAKLMGELSLRAYRKQFGIGTVAARISTAYGPRENESHAVMALIAKSFVKQSPFEIWGDGEQTRGFTYVTDVVDGLVRACEHIDDASPVNLGTADFTSLNRIAGIVFEAFAWRPSGGILHRPDRPVGVRHRALDGSIAKRRIGWEPKVALADGIGRTVEWYQASHSPAEVAARLEAQLMERRAARP